MSQHHDFHLCSMQSIPWNLLLPGDSFRLLSDWPSAQPTYAACGDSRNLMLRYGVIYIVISRRLGPEFPKPKDYYVILGPGVALEEHKL